MIDRHRSPRVRPSPPARIAPSPNRHGKTGTQNVRTAHIPIISDIRPGLFVATVGPHIVGDSWLPKYGHARHSRTESVLPPVSSPLSIVADEWSRGYHAVLFPTPKVVMLTPGRNIWPRSRLAAKNRTFLLVGMWSPILLIRRSWRVPTPPLRGCRTLDTRAFA